MMIIVPGNDRIWLYRLEAVHHIQETFLGAEMLTLTENWFRSSMWCRRPQPQIRSLTHKKALVLAKEQCI
jgi:hypothetical protein